MIYAQHSVVAMPLPSVVCIYLANDLDQVDLSNQLPKIESRRNLLNLENFRFAVLFRFVSDNYG